MCADEMRFVSRIAASGRTCSKLRRTVRWYQKQHSQPGVNSWLIFFSFFFLFHSYTSSTHTLSSLIFFDDHAKFSQRKKERTDNDIILVHP